MRERQERPGKAPTSAAIKDPGAGGDTGRRRQEMSQPQILLCMPDDARADHILTQLQTVRVPLLAEAGLANFDRMRTGTWGQGAATVVPDTPFSDAILATARSIGHIPVRQIALHVSDAAIARIEIAPARDGAGALDGAEIGAEIGANLETGIPEVNFGVSVADVARAERIVREAVRGKPFDSIREITRHPFESPAIS